MKNTALVSYVEDMLKRELVCAVQGGSYKDTLVIITNSPLLPERERELYAAIYAHQLMAGTVKIMYIEDLRMSLNGYGYVRKDGQILTSRVSPEHKTIFNSYQEVLRFFGAPTRLLAGNSQKYLSFVERAQKTVTAIMLVNYDKESFTLTGFSQKLLAGGQGILSLSVTESTLAYIAHAYWPHISELNDSGIVRHMMSTYQVVHPERLELPYIKDATQLALEEQYLGAHESEDSWSVFTNSIRSAGLRAYQTERPLEYQTPAELEAHATSELPEQGMESINDLVDEMNGLVNKYSINQSTVNFMAFPESGNSKAAVAASMLIPLWNQNLISVDKSAPIGSLIEVQVIEWLRRLVGYDCEPTTSAENIGGIAGAGGVMSNTNGLLVARSVVFAESRRKGLTRIQKTPYLLIADKTLEHYSHKAAFWWLGLGEDNVIPVKSNGFCFDIEDLKSKIEIYNSGDNVVVAVVCLAGDSRTMTVQNIAEIHAETSKHNIWLHVDACQGGVGLFSSHKDELCGDYKLADSVSIDPHKGLAVPYSSSFCLFKDQYVLTNISKSTDITIAKGSYDIGQVTPFLGSRPFDSLKLWALLKFHGLDGLRQNVDYRIELTKNWAKYVNQSGSFVAMNDPELTAISFSVSPEKIGRSDITLEELSILNKAVHDKCYKAGWLVIHCYDLIDFENRLDLNEMKPLRVLGTNFGNVLLDQSHFSKIVAYMESQLQSALDELSETSEVKSAKQEAVTA